MFSSAGYAVRFPLPPCKSPAPLPRLGRPPALPVVRTNPLFTSMVFAWSATEVIRLLLLRVHPTWERAPRSAVPPLHHFLRPVPLGASSEAFLMFATLPTSFATWAPADFARAALFAIWWPGACT
ncbi:hypothetical protein BD779DRAFT_1669609 [Infundibulicybe gibba]|nr:hypothetical protein BD779DRAFT_1669609 [Infundibulicybe gibba]